MYNTRPLYEDEAHRALSEVHDPITQNLVMFGIACARMQFIRYEGESDNEWARRLPAAPLDMRFMVQVLLSIFGNKQQAIRQLLEGKTIEESTGWDV